MDRALVVKNTIVRIAFRQIGIKEVNGFIQGSLLLTFGGDQPQVVSKVLVGFAKDHDKFQLAGACLEGKFYETDYVKSLATLPTRDVLVASVVNGLNAPIGRFVSVIAQLIRSLTVVLDQLSKSKKT